jgi:hypothetical protein
MPNFVKVDSKPFHPDTYMGPEHDDEEQQQGDNLRERSMTIKLKVENTVRWRWAKDEFGQDVSFMQKMYSVPANIRAIDPTIKRPNNTLVRWHIKFTPRQRTIRHKSEH